MAWVQNVAKDRSRGEERLQLKWFTYAAALLPLVFLDDLLPGAAEGPPGVPG
jgi:hypothetical protein